jgi:hypothetical protein
MYITRGIDLASEPDVGRLVSSNKLIGPSDCATMQYYKSQLLVSYS